MKNCFYYFTIAPIKRRYYDSSYKRPLIRIPVQTKSRECEIAMYGSKKTKDISFLRITIPECEEGNIKDKDLDLIQVLKEHALSVLRITYDVNVALTQYVFWTFHDPQYRGTILNVDLKEKYNPNYQINATNIRNVYSSSFDHREEIKLLSDSMHKSIPLQYRYLSVYKIIELHHRASNGKLDTSKLDAYLNTFKDKTSRAKIITLRDRCAHIKNKKGLFGVTELNRKDAQEIGEFLPTLQDICLDLLNKLSQKKFTLGRGKFKMDEINA